MLKRLSVFHFSGTGNSYRAATWLVRHAMEQGIESHVGAMDLKQSVEVEANQCMGLIYPTHGFTAPWHVLKFAFRLPRASNVDAFVLTARAGLKFGAFYPPGISGTAAFIIALILAFKGYRVLGTASVDMPSNWFSLHPIQREQAQAALLGRARNVVSSFSQKVLGGKKVWFTLNNAYELIWGLVLWPVSLLYLCVGRFFLAKLFFANDNCNGCGHCARHCPVGAISMRGKSHKRPFWRYNCESCMRCAGFCPEGAVEAGHSWGVVLYLVTSIPVGTFILAYGGEAVDLSGVLDLFWFYLSLILSYQVFSLVVRFPAINRLFAVTTFTHLPGWGRYREPDADVREFSSDSERRESKRN